VWHGLVFEHVQHLEELELNGFDRSGGADDHASRAHCIHELLVHRVIHFGRTVAGEGVDALVHDGGEGGTHNTAREFEQRRRYHLCRELVNYHNIVKTNKRKKKRRREIPAQQEICHLLALTLARGLQW
jgi:hypothetical protein